MAAVAAANIVATVSEGDGSNLNCICRIQYVVQGVEQHGFASAGVCGVCAVGTNSAGGPRAACGGASGVVDEGWPTSGGVPGSSRSRSTSDAGAGVIGAGSVVSDGSARTDVTGHLLASSEASLIRNSARDIAIEP